MSVASDIDPAAFQAQHLQRVSRSFAFCIAQLREPMRSWIGLSYLMCRILDTIEDASFSDLSLQIKLFSQFESALERPESLAADWFSHFPVSVESGEMRLLKDAPEVLAQFHALPQVVQPWVRQMVRIMATGMKSFLHKKKMGVLRLETLDELGGYCYVVAGVVGEALSRILASVDSTFLASELALSRSRQFGEFLQKVNILKDQARDEGEGRFLVPDREKVWRSSFDSAQQSFAYIEGLPTGQIEFRRFCAWSLFMGLETLKSMRELGQSKISRDALERVLLRVETGFVAADSSLQNYFDELSSQIWLKA